ncbi:MAG TPA: hypothetical protein VMB47_12555 [Candidatus Aquilonibacter sp.]|nr:hypothetical protein [Candidatus Aquilonibacter sp.]
MGWNSAGIKKAGWLAIVALAAVLGSLPMISWGKQHSAKGGSECTVKSTNYLGWKAEQLANRWVKLEIVPQIGGRLMQVTFNGHDFLYVNSQAQGQVFTPETTGRGPRNYGGDKIWPLPEGDQDEQHWLQGGFQPLDYGDYELQVLSRGPTCAVRMTGPPSPDIGQRYIREISIGSDSPVISFHNVMQNVSGFPQTWSEQTISEYPTHNPDGTPNTNLWSVTQINPQSAYPGGYHIETGPKDNDAYSVSDGNLRVHWNDISQEVWIDSATGWLAMVDGTSGYTMVERHQIDPTAEYPGKATIIFYSAGARRPRRAQTPNGAAPGAPLDTQNGTPSGPQPGSPQAQPTQPGMPGTSPSQNPAASEGPFIEEEVNSPMEDLVPGQSYALDTTWYPTRMGADFKTTTWAGVVGTPLTATRTSDGLVLSGDFGVFYAGTLVAHLYPGREVTQQLMPVTPFQPVHLQMTLQAPANIARVSVHLVDANGLDRGPLGEVLVNPPPPRTGRHDE